MQLNRRKQAEGPASRAACCCRGIAHICTRNRLLSMDTARHIADRTSVRCLGNFERARYLALLIGVHTARHSPSAHLPQPVVAFAC